MANIARGVRERSHLSSQLGRGVHRNDRQSDFGFDDRFQDLNLDDGAMFNGQNDDYRFDNFGDAPFGDFTSKCPLLYVRNMARGSDYDIYLS